MPIDIIEQNIYDISPELLDILLQDKTTGKHIKWATDNYHQYGDGYWQTDPGLAAAVVQCITVTTTPRSIFEMLVSWEYIPPDQFPSTLLCRMQQR